MSATPDSPYLTARQAAAYLQINEKKLYELAGRRELPAARVGGKWLFPRQLLDQWLLEQAHGGLFADRLLVGGAEDPLLQAALQTLGDALGDDALIAHVPSATGIGLRQLSARRLDACLMHWGPARDGDTHRRALLERQRHSAEWTAVRLGRREQGVMLKDGLGVDALHLLAGCDYRWAMQPSGSGNRYGLQIALEAAGFRLEDCGGIEVRTARQAAAAVARGAADCAAGPRSIAVEHGLAFLPLAMETLDLVVPRGVFFRRLFQRLLETIDSAPLRHCAEALGGYDLSPLGRVLPPAE